MSLTPYGMAVERAAIPSGGDFPVGGGGLRQGALFGQLRHTIELRVVALETREIEMGQIV